MPFCLHYTSLRFFIEKIYFELKQILYKLMFWHFLLLYWCSCTCPCKCQILPMQHHSALTHEPWVKPSSSLWNRHNPQAWQQGDTTNHVHFAFVDPGWEMRLTVSITASLSGASSLVMCPGMPQGCVLSPLRSLRHGLSSHLLLRQHASSPGGPRRSSWATGGPRGIRDAPLPPSLFHGKLSVSTASSYLVPECSSSGEEGLKKRPPLPQEAEICGTLRSWQSPWAMSQCNSCRAAAAQQDKKDLVDTPQGTVGITALNTGWSRRRLLPVETLSTSWGLRNVWQWYERTCWSQSWSKLDLD